MKKLFNIKIIIILFLFFSLAVDTNEINGSQILGKIALPKETAETTEKPETVETAEKAENAEKKETIEEKGLTVKVKTKKITFADLKKDTFFETAQAIHWHLMQEKYWYPTSKNLEKGKMVEDCNKPIKHKLPVYGEKMEKRYVDCSAYVCLVINTYKGIKSKKKIYTSTFLYYNNPYHLKRVKRKNRKPGDILVIPGHTEIYAGNGMSYSCGSSTHTRIRVKEAMNGKNVRVFRVK